MPWWLVAILSLLAAGVAAFVIDFALTNHPGFLAVFGVIPAAIVGCVVLIPKLTKPKSVNRYNTPGAAPTGRAPGWYPDQNDPSLLRYFDGRMWTSSTQPRS